VYVRSSVYTRLIIFETGGYEERGRGRTVEGQSRIAKHEYRITLIYIHVGALKIAHLNRMQVCITLRIKVVLGLKQEA
jgi:hypothetical protein